jgi:hypothetical protein
LRSDTKQSKKEDGSSQEIKRNAKDTNIGIISIIVRIQWIHCNQLCQLLGIHQNFASLMFNVQSCWVIASHSDSLLNKLGVYFDQIFTLKPRSPFYHHI